MKKIYGFAFAASLLALASCSNDVEPTPNPTPGGEDALGYLAINIAIPAETRGTTDGYIAGSDLENNCTSGTFLFFDANGNMTQTPQSVGLSFKTQGQDTPAIEKVLTDAVVVIAGDSKRPVLPTSCLVILNDPGFSFLPATDNLESVLAKVSDAQVDLIKSGKGAFIMTNSTHFAEDGSVVNAAPISANDIKETEAAALATGGVTIYVERMAAKVNVLNPTSGKFDVQSTDVNMNFIDEDTKDLIDNGGNPALGVIQTEKITLTPVVKGLQIANRANTEYLFKKVNSDWSTDAFVNNSVNMRTNWAITPADMTYTNTTWATGDGINKAHAYDSENLPSFYLRENTSDTHSSLLLTAQLVDGEDNPVTFIKWAGRYYSDDEFKSIQGLNFLRHLYKREAIPGTDEFKMVNLKATDVTFNFYDADTQTAIWKNEGGTYNELLTYDGTLEPMLQYESALYATLNENIKVLYVKSNDADAEGGFKAATTGEDNATATKYVNNTLIQKGNRVWRWVNGMCYYYVDIEHDGTDDYAVGVVRNNMYNITLGSLKGLGTPVYDPNEFIIPTKPEDKSWYFAAQINILKWRIIGQVANFE